jgi:Inhibitor of Apoptosis domain
VCSVRWCLCSVFSSFFLLWPPNNTRIGAEKMAIDTSLVSSSSASDTESEEESSELSPSSGLSPSSFLSSDSDADTSSEPTATTSASQSDNRATSLDQTSNQTSGAERDSPLEALASPNGHADRIATFQKRDGSSKKGNKHPDAQLRWPHAFSSPKPRDLAQAGFVFDPISAERAAAEKKKRKARLDRVQCVYCKILLFGWEEGDDPLADHLHEAPKCELARLLEEQRKKPKAKQAKEQAPAEPSPSNKSPGKTEKKEKGEKKHTKAKKKKLSSKSPSQPFLGTPPTPRLASRLQDPARIKELSRLPPGELEEQIGAMKADSAITTTSPKKETSRPKKKETKAKKKSKSSRFGTLTRRGKNKNKGKDKDKDKGKDTITSGEPQQTKSQSDPSIRRAGDILLTLVECKVHTEYFPADGTELTLRSGESVWLLHAPNDKKQWKGRLEDGTVGFFDSQCVNIVEHDGADEELDEDRLFADLVDAVTPTQSRAKLSGSSSSSDEPDLKLDSSTDSGEMIPPEAQAPADDDGSDSSGDERPYVPPNNSRSSSSLTLRHASGPAPEEANSAPPAIAVLANSNSTAEDASATGKVSASISSSPPATADERDSDSNVRKLLADQIAACDHLRKQVSRLIESSTAKDTTIDQLRARIAELEDDLGRST